MSRSINIYARHTPLRVLKGRQFGDVQEKMVIIPCFCHRKTGISFRALGMATGLSSRDAREKEAG